MRPFICSQFVLSLSSSDHQLTFLPCIQSLSLPFTFLLMDILLFMESQTYQLGLLLFFKQEDDTLYLLSNTFLKFKVSLALYSNVFLKINYSSFQLHQLKYNRKKTCGNQIIYLLPSPSFLISFFLLSILSAQAYGNHLLSEPSFISDQQYPPLILPTTPVLYTQLGHNNYRSSCVPKMEAI